MTYSSHGGFRFMIHPGYSSVGVDHDENTHRTAEFAKRRRDRTFPTPRRGGSSI